MGGIMKKLVLAGAALAVLVGGPALAADLPVKAPIIAPVYDWTGFYVGINAGSSFGRSESDLAFTGFPTVSGTSNINGGIAGGQAGYNWQFNPKFLFGVEADIQAAWQRGTLEIADGPFCVTPITTNFPVTTCRTAQAALEQRIPWFGTGRVRLGALPFPDWLFYATGGVAFAEIENNVAVSQATSVTTFIGATPVPGVTSVLTAVGSANATRVGWTVGAGTEYVLGSGWTGKLEYLFIDYGSFSTTYTLAGVPVLTTTSHMTDNILRVGLNYRFGGPVVAKY